MKKSTAKLFKFGRSQAVRLPKAFQFKADRVRIKKDEEKVILEPMERTEWPKGFWSIFTSDSEFETPAPLPPVPVDEDGSRIQPR